MSDEYDRAMSLEYTPMGLRTVTGAPCTFDMVRDVALHRPSQFDRMQEAAARRSLAASATLPLPDTLAQQIAVHAAENGGERAAYAYLDDLTREVGRALKKKGSKP